MNTFFRRNFAVVIAFALPILLIIIVTLVAYIPSFTLSTDYDFVYATCKDTSYNYYDNYCDNYMRRRYVVENDRIVMKEIASDYDSNGDGIPDKNEQYTVYFFLHDTDKNESREIPFSEVQSLNLNGLMTSPDGVSVTYLNGYNDFFPFRGGDNSGYYLTKGGSKRMMNTISQNDLYRYERSMNFIGWVVK